MSNWLFCVCPKCEGNGMKVVARNKDGFEKIKCPRCNGTGFAELSRVTPLEDYQAMTRQAQWLRRRYGKVQTSIKDYWNPEHNTEQP